MALVAFDDLAAGVFREGKRTESDPLINLHAGTDFGGFADHDAGSVVNENTAPQTRSGVNVDSGDTVCILAQHTGNQRHFLLIQAMRNTLDCDRFDSGVAQDDFIQCFRRGIAVECRLNVKFHAHADLRERGQQVERRLLRLALTVAAGFGENIAVVAE